MTFSEQINDLATALAKAQGEIQNVTKDAKNPHFKSDYASLDAITDVVRPVFAKHGLSVVQMPVFADGIVTVETLVLHSSGQWIRGASGAPVQKADPQGVGSATTYLRRYSLAAIAALAQTDDDGNAASGNGSKPTEKAKPAKPEGFDDWWIRLMAAARIGVGALRDEWKAGTSAYRTYTDQCRKDAWERLKADAEQVTAHAA